MEDLKSAPLLLREHGSGTRRVLEMALDKVGMKKPFTNVIMQLDSTEAIISSVEAGLGIGFVSRWAVDRRLPLGRIKTARVDRTSHSAQLLPRLSLRTGAARHPGSLPSVCSGIRQRRLF